MLASSFVPWTVLLAQHLWSYLRPQSLVGMLCFPSVGVCVNVTDVGRDPHNFWKKLAPRRVSELID